MAVHDIRMQIPLVARNQSDPGIFYEYQEYPKMMLMLCDQKYLDEWLARNVAEDERGRKSWKGGRPRVGSLVPILDDDFRGVVVNDADEEETFRADHPEAAVQRSGPPPDQGEFTALEQRNKAMEAELAELRAKLAGTTEGKDAALQAEADKEAVKPKENGGQKAGLASMLKLPKDLK